MTIGKTFRLISSFGGPLLAVLIAGCATVTPVELTDRSTRPSINTTGSAFSTPYLFALTGVYAPPVWQPVAVKSPRTAKRNAFFFILRIVVTGEQHRVIPGSDRKIDLLR